MTTIAYPSEEYEEAKRNNIPAFVTGPDEAILFDSPGEFFEWHNNRYPEEPIQEEP